MYPVRKRRKSTVHSFRSRWTGQVCTIQSWSIPSSNTSSALIHSPISIVTVTIFTLYPSPSDLDHLVLCIGVFSIRRVFSVGILWCLFIWITCFSSLRLLPSALYWVRLSAVSNRPLSTTTSSFICLSSVTALGAHAAKMSSVNTHCNHVFLYKVPKWVRWNRNDINTSRYEGNT